MKDLNFPIRKPENLKKKNYKENHTQSLNSAWHIVGAQQIFVKWINEWLKKVKEWTLLQCQWAIQNSNANQQSTRLQRLYSLMEYYYSVIKSFLNSKKKKKTTPRLP